MNFRFSRIIEYQDYPILRLADFSHEVRTPLTLLKMCLALINEEMELSNDFSIQLKDFLLALRELVDNLFQTTYKAIELEQEGNLWDDFDVKMQAFNKELIILINRIDLFKEELLDIPIASKVDLLKIFQSSAKHVSNAIDWLAHPIFDLPEPLIAWLEIREGVKEKLERGDGRILESLIQARNSPIPEIRDDAVGLLQQLNHQSSVDAIIPALDDEVAEVRWRACDVLGKLGDARAIEPLRKCLNDENKIVRKKAEETIEILSR